MPERFKNITWFAASGIRVPETSSPPFVFSPMSQPGTVEALGLRRKGLEWIDL